MLSTYRKLEIKEIINKRRIKHLVHFTQAKNLENILKYGLISRNEALRQGIEICVSDQSRFDTRTNSINLSVMYPNYSMFYSKRKIISGDWAVLIISPEVIYENNCEFSITNAATTDCNLGDSPESFSKMFCKSVINNARCAVTRKATKISDCCPTDPQAEVLVEGTINPDKIMAIAFETLTVKNHHISQIASSLKKSIRDNFIVEDSLFKSRHDYQYWPSKDSVRNNFSTPELPYLFNIGE